MKSLVALFLSSSMLFAITHSAIASESINESFAQGCEEALREGGDRRGASDAMSAGQQGEPQQALCDRHRCDGAESEVAMILGWPFSCVYDADRLLRYW